MYQMYIYQVLAIVKEIEETFIQGIPLVAWMDDKTREIAIEKVRKIVQMIGYPDWILDTVQLDKYYQNVSTTLSNGIGSIC